MVKINTNLLKIQEKTTKDFLISQLQGGQNFKFLFKHFPFFIND
jgi:hypothetical protein